MNQIKPGKYRHFKGSIAVVIGNALHTETKEEMVVYQHVEAETGINKLWVRPQKMFTEEVLCNRKKVKRFTYIEDQK